MDYPIPGKQYRLTGGSNVPALSNGNSWNESEVGNKIEAQVAKYVILVQELMNDYWKERKFTFDPPPKISAEYGRRYARIVTTNSQRSVHTFIDLTNGNILKAGTWNAPAKNGVRGNIFSDDLGRSVINEHGANYLK